MDYALPSSIALVVVFVLFVAVCRWAWGAGREARFREAADLPFADEGLHRESSRPDRGRT